MSWPELLHATLDKRAMPETVAKIITDDPDAAGYFTPDEMVLLRRVATARAAWWVTSMPEDFERPPDASAQIAVALSVFGAELDGDIRADPAGIARLIDELGEPLGWRHGMDWKRDRLPKDRRRAGEVPQAWTGHRTYNKHVRVLRNLEDKRARMARAQAFRHLILIGRSGFAVDIPRERFIADPDSAAFIAYWAARKNRRRLFSLAGKENPMDHLAAALLERCHRSGHADWVMIAQVCPRPEVLQKLPDEDLGALAGRWWHVMRDCSSELAAAWPGDQVNRMSMIVRRGMDSSTWNTMAQAYNAARAGWLNCTSLAGAGALTAPFLPGKVMRLMAADLAYWHSASGGDVDPDTKAWARLAFPWDVINGLADCTRADVEAACADAGVDPVARGWTAPHASGDLAEFVPTPELVHGVAIGDPQWAALLRRAGVFSGKQAGDVIEAARLRAAAGDAGVIEGELPVYLGGQYAGTTKQLNT